MRTLLAPRSHRGSDQTGAEVLLIGILVFSPWQRGPGPLRLGEWTLPKYQEPLYQGFGARLTASSLSLKAALKPRKVFSATKMVATHAITRAIIVTGMDVVAFMTTR
jgi:hypothetical protein